MLLNIIWAPACSRTAFSQATKSHILVLRYWGCPVLAALNATVGSLCNFAAFLFVFRPSPGCVPGFLNFENKFCEQTRPRASRSLRKTHSGHILNLDFYPLNRICVLLTSSYDDSSLWARIQRAISYRCSIAKTSQTWLITAVLVRVKMQLVLLWKLWVETCRFH